jgi:hypothetical protein
VCLGRKNPSRPERMCFMSKTLWPRIGKLQQSLGLLCALLAVTLLPALSTRAAAQDQDDPPSRVARLGYIQGSVSFQPAGEDEWVEAVPNRPMTTGDKLWADRDSRAEVQLGSATINLAPNTGFSFLNLDDRTTQIQLNAGSLNVRVWYLDRDNVFEIDTPNQAFTVEQPGRYRLDASEDGNYTVVAIRQGEGESTGNGQSYTIHAGQRFTFSGNQTLNAEVDQLGGPDDFDRWSDQRERRYEDSPSARYCSRRVVGYQDLDDYGDWRPSRYGNIWFPRVDPGWAPYREGHWAWIDPWGWTWVDNEPWGYAPFHYGRWVSVYGRWGWVPGPVEEHPVYAPALVAFVGGGFVAGGGVAWFPLGPREVYVPSYRVSEAYVNRVNVTNTTVNTTVVRNVYNTTIVNNNTTINNVTYVNRNVQGAVTAVPQHAFVSAQPVAKAAVAVNTRQLARGPVSARAAVPPAREAVLGVHAATAGRVAAPPQAVVSRPVIAKAAPPPPPPPFAARQQALAQHPGQPLPRQEMAKLRKTAAPAAPPVRVAPPAKPATPTPAANRPGNQPGAPANARPGGTPPAQPAPTNQPGAGTRPGQPTPATPPANGRPAQPGYRPQPNQPAPNNRAEQPAQPPARNDRAPSAQPNRPEPNPPNNRAEQPTQPPARNDRAPSAQPNRPEPNPPNNRAEQPAQPPARNDRAPSAQPNRPEPNPPNNRAEQPEQPPARNDRPPSARPNRPEPNPSSDQPARTGHPPTESPNNRYSEQPNNRPTEPPRNEPSPRTQAPPPNPRPDNRPPAEARPQQQRPQAQPTPEDKKKQDQKKKDENKKPQ